MNLKSQFAMFAAAATLFLASCKKDKAFNESGALKLNGGMAAAPSFTSPTGPWVVWGGKGDLYWSGAINGYGTLPATLSFPAAGNFGVNYAVGGRAAFNYLYKLSSSNVGSRGIQRYSVSSTGAVTESGAFFNLGGSPLMQTNEINFSLYKPDTAYYTNADATPAAERLKVFRFNPTATPMTAAGYTAIDFSAVFNPSASNVTNPITTTASTKLIGSKMIIDRGDYIFADVLFGNSYNSLKQVVQADNNVYVAAFNKSTGHITVSSFTGASNIGLFNDAPLVSRDEVTGDIYFSTLGNMATSTSLSKILKIDAASNTINASWNIDMAANFSGRKGEFNALLVHDNIIYTKIPKTDVTYLGSGHGVSYRSDIWQWTAVNALTKASKRLNVPLDNYYAYQNARLINNEVYFIYNNSTPANNAGIRKIPALNTGTFGSATSPIATTAVSGFTSAAGYIRIMGLDRL
ncbi:hypothetical protein DBR43_00590 [Pedobacter sp. KBW06]|uniref:hypothetical protein n=1 Tax=Pedobacter sp. KBW06 TaxID=2153359 RepID=UPI000F5B3B02|nr:hypothetical protein [Pedobacter sp. KBW06]RQO73939.1 hypothetical protein DBR43_00590 [Pedobacter sp. KBW06]